MLLVITLPLFSLRLGFPDDGNNQESETSRQAYDLLTEGFGPGFNGPLLLVVDLEGASDPERHARPRSARRSQATEGVAFVAPADPEPGRRHRHRHRLPHDQAAGRSHIRPSSTSCVTRCCPTAVDGTGAEVLVGGFTAISIDQSNYISDRLPLFIGAVVLLSFLLLTTVFRSPLVALKAGIMNLLSIAAAYGVMAYAVQGNWFGDLLGHPRDAGAGVHPDDQLRHPVRPVDGLRGVPAQPHP